MSRRVPLMGCIRRVPRVTCKNRSGDMLAIRQVPASKKPAKGAALMERARV